MKPGNAFIGVGIATVAMCASASPDASQDVNAVILPRVLEKRDAFTCYGSNASTTDCQAVLDKIQSLGDQTFALYSGLCLNWDQDTCNVRFCAQPWVTKTVNRTASWIYNWANGSLMDCVRGGQYAVMGDSSNLNGNGGTYRLHLESKTPR
ncbi:hypothetical protein HD806DRAFT_107528 [Xylariaceae sp. AK1471]|nr:hypothetical protein HD806DRAFT_107528 [Xylariaceae sp. AK1471]